MKRTKKYFLTALLDFGAAFALVIAVILMDKKFTTFQIAVIALLVLMGFSNMFIQKKMDKLMLEAELKVESQLESPNGTKDATSEIDESEEVLNNKSTENSSELDNRN